MFYNIRKGVFNNTLRNSEIGTSGRTMTAAYPNGTVTQGFLNLPGTVSQIGETILSLLLSMTMKWVRRYFIPFAEYSTIGSIYLQLLFPTRTLRTIKKKGKRVLRDTPEYSSYTPFHPISHWSFKEKLKVKQYQCFKYSMHTCVHVIHRLYVVVVRSYIGQLSIDRLQFTNERDTTEQCKLDERTK